jgi:C-8 sterol isomerase
VDDYFIILAGEQWAFSAGQFDRDIYRPGDMHHLARGHAKQYKMPDTCWALEYARGLIPTMLPFGLADTFTSTLDFHTLAQSVWIYSKSAAKELLQGKI